MTVRRRKIVVSITLLTAGVSLGLMAYAFAPYWRAWQAVYRFQNSDQAGRISVVRCEFDQDRIRGRIEIEPGGPNWLQWVRIGKLGPFDKVRRVWLRPFPGDPGPLPLPKCFAEIQYFPGLTWVELAETTATDSDLAVVAKCQSVEYLGLASTLVTDAGMEHICNLQSLQTLMLWDTKVSDAGMLSLSKCHSLRYLFVSSAVTNVGIESITNLSELRSLWVAGPSISDRSAAAISKLENLEFLSFDKTSVTDEGLRSVSRLPHLQQLWMRDTMAISDEGLRHIERMSTLQFILVSECHATEDGIRRLKAARPNAIVRVFSADKTPTAGQP
jgi:hypothetical protein